MTDKTVEAREERVNKNMVAGWYHDGALALADDLAGVPDMAASHFAHAAAEAAVKEMDAETLLAIRETAGHVDPDAVAWVERAAGHSWDSSTVAGWVTVWLQRVVSRSVSERRLLWRTRAVERELELMLDSVAITTIQTWSEHVVRVAEHPFSGDDLHWAFRRLWRYLLWPTLHGDEDQRTIQTSRILWLQSLRIIHPRHIVPDRRERIVTDTARALREIARSEPGPVRDPNAEEHGFHLLVRMLDKRACAVRGQWMLATNAIVDRLLRDVQEGSSVLPANDLSWALQRLWHDDLCLEEERPGLHDALEAVAERARTTDHWSSHRVAHDVFQELSRRGHHAAR